MRITTMASLKRHQAEMALAGLALPMGAATAAAQQPHSPVGSR